MSKFKELVATAVNEIHTDIKVAAKGIAEGVAKAPTMPIPSDTKNVMVFDSETIDAQRVGELAFITKTVRKDGLTPADKTDLTRRFKAVGVTQDFPEILPSGFTGALIHDLRKRLTITSLFPFKEVNSGQHDTIAIYGIKGFLSGEASKAQRTNGAYLTMMYLTQKCFASVAKSFEIVDDSLIPLVQEVRNEIIEALARAIEEAIINGDDSLTHMDAGVSNSEYIRAFKGLRKLGLAKAPVDFGGVALTETQLQGKLMEMQEAGGIYTDEQAIARGDLVLIVDQNLLNSFKLFQGFLSGDKAGFGTLFGMPVASIFGIPVVQTAFLPKVNAAGVVDANAANNIFGSCILVNRTTMRYYNTGAPLLQTAVDAESEIHIFMGSVRAGFNSIFDRTQSNIDAIDSSRVNIVMGINIAR